MGESGERGWILVIDVSSDRPMGSDHTLNQNFSHKEFFKKYSYLVILNRLEETNISICFSINRFFKASSLFISSFKEISFEEIFGTAHTIGDNCSQELY